MTFCGSAMPDQTKAEKEAMERAREVWNEAQPGTFGFEAGWLACKEYGEPWPYLEQLAKDIGWSSTERDGLLYFESPPSDAEPSPEGVERAAKALQYELASESKGEPNWTQMTEAEREGWRAQVRPLLLAYLETGEGEG